MIRHYVSCGTHYEIVSFDLSLKLHFHRHYLLENRLASIQTFNFHLFIFSSVEISKLIRSKNVLSVECKNDFDFHDLHVSFVSVLDLLYAYGNLVFIRCFSSLQTALIRFSSKSSGYLDVFHYVMSLLSSFLLFFTS
jgi:hypothetical protein